MLTYPEYVNTYLNKRNSATGMYWRTEDVANQTATPLMVVQAYLDFSQDKNLESVEATGVPATDEQLIEMWYAEHPRQGIMAAVAAALDKYL
jgi:hypothetical protein